MKASNTIPLVFSILLSVNAHSATILWGSVLPEASVWRNGVKQDLNTYTSTTGLGINAARVLLEGFGVLSVWVNEYVDFDTGVPVPSHWETECPEIILDDGRAEWNQFLLGDAPNGAAKVTMEVGYVDLDDWFSVFVPLASATATVGQLMDADHTYEAGTLGPPTENPWTPMDFHAVDADIPEPSTVCMFLAGVLLLTKRRGI